jgi:predicted nucleotidyltransferase
MLSSRSKPDFDGAMRCRIPLSLNWILLWEKSLKPSEALHSNRAAIRRVVESHRARNARVFGSVLHGQDTDSSDLDILIDPTPETTLFDIGAIRHELGKLLGVPVDVLTPNALPDKFRAVVLAEARPV